MILSISGADLARFIKINLKCLGVQTKNWKILYISSKWSEEPCMQSNVNYTRGPYIKFLLSLYSKDIV